MKNRKVMAKKRGLNERQKFVAFVLIRLFKPPKKTEYKYDKERAIARGK